MRRRRRRRPSCAGQPRFADLESIVRTAWAWHRAPSARLRCARRIRERRRPARSPVPLRDARTAARLGVGRARHARLRGGSAGLASLIKPIFDNVLPNQRATGAHGVRRSSALYLLKGIGSYVSSYLMADVGQRVVMDLRNALYRHILGQSAGFFAQRTDRPADVAHQQRRRPGAAGGLGDGRRSGARDRWRWSATRRCCSTTTRGWRSSA